jgi:NAD-dependent dihydropyrimidine dehydrogenase PreA subunit
MADLKINGIAVSVESGATVLAAAEKLSVDIPTLCYLKGAEPETSCMLCVVKDNTSGRMIPACSARAADGMDIDTECAEVQAARRDILNLLLSEHTGDCEAPCRRICPAHLNIPLMLREIERGNFESAAWIARRDLAIPTVLGYICPAPCEKGCRRGQVDQTITIRASHRQVAENFKTPEMSFPINGKKVAVTGSGAAGLSCAWNLRLLGYDCTVFDVNPVAGGALRSEPLLPPEVLDAEIRSLQSAGIKFKLESSAPAEGFDAVIEPEEHKLAVKAVANGKAAAQSLSRTIVAERFDSKIGKLRDSELQELMKNCPADEQTGASALQIEAARCLHCDCRKPESCKLRNYAEKYGADPREFPADERKHVQLIGHNEAVVFEPGKCVKCGLCVRITKRAGETLGLAFAGRGFNTQVTVPFGESLQNGLRIAAAECVAACPTGAIAFMNSEESRERGHRAGL